MLAILIVGFLTKTCWKVFGRLDFKLYLKTASRFSRTAYHVLLLKFVTLSTDRFEGVTCSGYAAVA